MTGWRIAVKEQRILKQKKIVGLQIFSMPVLKFGDIWENFGRWKKLFALEMASCWQIFFCKTNEILHSANKAVMAKSWAWYMWLVELIANFITTKPEGKQ